MSEFLDLVRAVGRLTEERGCDGDCSPALHRREASQLLGLLLEHPELLSLLNDVAYGAFRRAAAPSVLPDFGRGPTDAEILASLLEANEGFGEAQMTIALELGLSAGSSSTAIITEIRRIRKQFVNPGG